MRVMSVGTLRRVKTFSSPPGWPVPPVGWKPPAGWQPDPSWPAPPADWTYWVDVPDQVPAPELTAAYAPRLTPSYPTSYAPAPELQLAGPQGYAPPPAFAPPVQALYPAASMYPAPAPQPADTAYASMASAGVQASPVSPYSGGFAPSGLTGYQNAVARVRADAKKDIIGGSIWFTIGVLVTTITWLAAPGGKFFFVWGAIVFGAYQAIKGIVRWNTAESRALEAGPNGV